MRTLAIGCCIALLAGCAKPEQQAAKDSTAGSLGAGAAPAALTLGAVAGTWTMNVTPANSDSVILTFELVASADPAGWTFNFPGRPAVPVRIVAVDGDSIVSEAGPYESALRKGVQVSTSSVMRLVNGELLGTTTARYASTGADSVLMLHTHGTRTQ